jgi:hypothetical protein
MGSRETPPPAAIGAPTFKTAGSSLAVLTSVAPFGGVTKSDASALSAPTMTLGTAG